MSYSFASEQFLHTSFQCAKKCSCLRTIKASIGTITTFTRNDSSPVRCTDWRAGQTAPAVPAEQQHLGLESLCQHCRHRLTSCRVRATGRAAAVGTFCENGDGADGIFKRLEARVLDFFLRPEVICARTCEMQSCMTSKIS